MNRQRLILRGPLEASGVLMDAQAANATVARTARYTCIIGWETANSAKMTLGPFGWWCLCVRIARCIRGLGQMSIVLQQLRKVLAIFGFHHHVTSFPLGLARPWLFHQAVLKLGHLFRHHKIGMRIIVEIVQFQCQTCFVQPPFARYIVQHTLLFRLANSIRFAWCHFQYKCVCVVCVCYE